MSDFNDRPLVMGSVVGLRSFRVDSLGRLTGYTHRTVFTPGENVGECRKGEDDATGGWLLPHRAFWGFSDPWSFTVGPTWSAPSIVDDAPGVKDVTLAHAKPKHRVGQKDCTCGYYAYFDGQNDYHDKSDARLAGLIEGYGNVTIGERGFRAQKAKLVALIIPAKPDPKLAAKFDRVRHNYRDVAMFARKKDALSAHPLTPPEPLTPDNCDDFWTREASR
jgi:hypothetical protein